MKNSTTPLLIILISLLLILLFSCAPDHQEIKECITTSPSGFWWGVWHGMIAPFSLVVSWFSDSVEMYDVNNNGGWYDFGFAIGAGIIFKSADKNL